MEGNLLSQSGEYFYSIAALFSCLAIIGRDLARKLKHKNERNIEMTTNLDFVL